MAFFSEDLDANPFFRSLQTVFRVKFDEAQSRQWVICVPQSVSIKGVKITGQFVDSHILKPSPYLKSQFVTTDKNNNRSLLIEGNKIKIISGNLANEISEIKILSEELSYNHNYQPFKLYIIDGPINSSVKKEKYMANCSASTSLRVELFLTIQQCKNFFQTVQSHSEVLENLDKAIYKFNKNYILFPNYLHDASNKLKDIISWATEGFKDCNSAEDREHFNVILKHAVENYVLIQVHCKVFSVIRDKFSEEDRFLSNRILKLYHLGLTGDQLGIREEFCCATTSAVVELASINGKNSPAEKLQCFQHTLELIPDDIYNSYKESDNSIKRFDHSRIPTLTSDDLIPLLVIVIVQARIQNLESNLYYVQNFSWNTSHRDKESFSLVTFQAAKEFIKSYNFAHLKPSNKKYTKELSLEELMNVTVQMAKDSKSKVDNDQGNTSSEAAHFPIDRHLQRVTKMIEDSTRETNANEDTEKSFSDSSSSFVNHTISSVKPEKLSRNEELGEFLLNLQQNSLGVTYGRQS